MSIDHKIAFITVTQNGLILAKQLQEKLETGDVYTTSKLAQEGCKTITPSLKEQTGELFKNYTALIFIMAAGITVRMIAPYLEDKLKDPAVLVIDERGQNVISILSGHMGGANTLTLEISKILGAYPVITTATDVNEKAALDNIAKTLNASIANFREEVKAVNSLLVQGEKVGLYQDDPYSIDTRGFKVIEELKNLDAFKKVVCITYKKYLELTSSKIVKVIPRDLVVGVGCRKDTPIELMEKSFDDFLEKHNIDINAVKCLVSIDIKAYEKAIITLSQKYNIPFYTLSKEEIAKADELFDKSEFVKKNVGVFSVAEPSAYLFSGGNLWIPKHKYQGITFAIGRIQK